MNIYDYCQTVETAPFVLSILISNIYFVCLFILFLLLFYHIEVK